MLQPSVDPARGTRWLAALALPALFLLEAAVAQKVVSPPPPNGMRTISPGGSTSVGIPTDVTTPPKVRQVTYVVLSPQREFHSADGKVLSGKMIAFEQMVAESPAGTEPNPPAATATPPAKPTVVKDGKVRLLVNSKTFEVPLARLSEDDRAFVEKIRAGIERTQAK